MNYKYVLTKTTYYNGEYTRTSCGIAAISSNDNVTVLSSIEDVTDEQNNLSKLVELCNKEKLEIEHLQNVVDDFCTRNIIVYEESE